MEARVDVLGDTALGLNGAQVQVYSANPVCCVVAIADCKSQMFIAQLLVLRPIHISGHNFVYIHMYLVKYLD